MAKLDEFITHFAKANYDAFMVNSQDEFLDEFTPDHLNRLKSLFYWDTFHPIGRYLAQSFLLCRNHKLAL